MEYQPIVMAAGRGSRMTELTSGIPKPLLPVGNKPMVWYTVDMLENAGFQDVIIVVHKSVVHDLKRALEEVHPVSVRLEYFVLPSESDGDDIGTADTLRLLHDKIKADMLIVSCDLIIDEHSKRLIHELADIHRLNNATVTMLVAPTLELTDGVTFVPGGRAQQRIEKDLIGLDKTGQKVLYLAADSDIDQITFHLSQLRRFPFIQLNMGLVDSHLYIIKQSLLELLKEDRSISTLKGDLIPLLVKYQLSGKQYQQSKPTAVSVNGGMLPYVTRDECSEDIDQLISNMSSMGSSSCHATNLSVDCNDVVCCAKVFREGLCLRANTLLSYYEANKRVIRYWIAQRAVGLSARPPENLFGDGITTGDKSTIKCSVIGDQSVIGERTKIINCVIMDHVTIESGASLTGCIVCSNACITAGAELRECLVGIKQTVKGKHANAMLLEHDDMIV